MVLNDLNDLLGSFWSLPFSASTSDIFKAIPNALKPCHFNTASQHYFGFVLLRLSKVGLPWFLLAQLSGSTDQIKQTRMTNGQWSHLIEKYGCTRTGLILKPCYVVMVSYCDEDWLTWLLGGGGQSAKVADCKVHLLTLLSCIIQWVICVAWRGYLLTRVLMMLSSTVVTLHQQWWCPWFNKMRAGNLCSEPPPKAGSIYHNNYEYYITSSTWVAKVVLICSHLLKPEINQARSNTLVPSRSSFLVPGRSKPGNSREASAAVWAWIKIVGSMSQQPNGPMVHHQTGARIKDSLKPFY